MYSGKLALVPNSF